MKGEKTITVLLLYATPLWVDETDLDKDKDNARDIGGDTSGIGIVDVSTEAPLHIIVKSSHLSRHCVSTSSWHCPVGRAIPRMRGDRHPRHTPEATELKGCASGIVGALRM